MNLDKTEVPLAQQAKVTDMHWQGSTQPAYFRHSPHMFTDEQNSQCLKLKPTVGCSGNVDYFYLLRNADISVTERP